MLGIQIKSLQVNFDSHRVMFPDWMLQPGQDALILGPSGSGKTTLLHLMSGLLSPTKGEIEIFGTGIHELKGAALDKFRRSKIGIVFQQPHLIKSLTVIENLKLARYLGGFPQDDPWIYEIIEELGLTSIRDQSVKKISQGQAQRVAIARSIMNKPLVLFGDEPTASLDDENCHNVIKLLKQQARICNASLVIATHDQRVKNEFENHLILEQPQA